MPSSSRTSALGMTGRKRFLQQSGSPLRLACCSLSSIRNLQSILPHLCCHISAVTHTIVSALLCVFICVYVCAYLCMCVSIFATKLCLLNQSVKAVLSIKMDWDNFSSVSDVNQLVSRSLIIAHFLDTTGMILCLILPCSKPLSLISGNFLDQVKVD